MIGQWTHHWLKTHGHAAQYFPKTTSTNLLAKESAMVESAPVVFYIADEQTSGRGQGNHKWLNSAAGSNLLMTCSLLSSQAPQPQLCLTFGEHLKKSCQQIWPKLEWQVKPPNDLLLENKKVAGILLETVSQGPQHRLLFGLGFNALDFPKSLEFEATSLQAHLQSSITPELWHQLISVLVAQILNDPALSLKANERLP
jgi:BirA family biotin operon repressor/biotin-[acetyl-CoA-carboxylase] ligase